MDISEISDIQSESGVIGTLINHPEYIAFADYLKPNHFFNQENACLYWAIQELYTEGITNIDSYNLTNKLNSNRAVQRAIEKYNLPSVQEILELFKETARRSPKEYKMLAENVATFSFKRDLTKTLEQLKLSCYEQNLSLEGLNNLVYSSLDNLTGKYVITDNIQTVGEVIDDIWCDIVNRRTGDGQYGIPSKYLTFMDYFTYEPGELVVVQGKYKEGKSVFLMNEVAHKLKNNVPTLVVDSEMPTRLYIERFLSHLTGIEMKRIKNGKYTAEEENIIMNCIAWLKTQPFVHIYEPNLTMEKLYLICKVLQNKMDLGFLVYDYLKSNETSSSDNYNKLGAMCDYLKNNIAGELDIPVLAACQLNRNGEVADSIKINRYLSVGIKWGLKTQEMIINDGVECGNAYAKIYVNRLGKQMDETDEEEYIDFVFQGDTMTIVEAEQHKREEVF